MKMKSLALLSTFMAVSVLAFADTTDTNSMGTSPSNTPNMNATNTPPANTPPANNPSKQRSTRRRKAKKQATSNNTEVNSSVGTTNSNSTDKSLPSDINNPMPGNQNNSGAPAGMGNNGIQGNTAPPAPAPVGTKQ